MFRLLISGMQAYNQLGLFFGSWICLTIGGLLAGSAFYWRVHALRATGTIVGVVPNGKLYAPVYRYTLDGQTHVAKANVSSNLVQGMTTGKTVRLLISPHNPSDARQAGDWTGELIGLVFLVPGAWLGWTALTAYPITPMTGLMAVGFIAYFAERGLRTFKRNGPHISISQWIDMVRQGMATNVDLSHVQPIESLVPADTLKATWHDQVAAQKKMAWVPALMAIIFPLIAISQASNMLQLEIQGIRVPGKVTEYAETDNSNGHWSYYAVVHFRTPGEMLGESIQFRDNVGGNPPPLRLGKAVTVLYIPGAPWTAVVDRGPVANFLIPALLLAGGAFAGWVTWVMLMTRPRVVAGGAPGSAQVAAE
jgi:hypothetical protein